MANYREMSYIMTKNSFRMKLSFSKMWITLFWSFYADNIPFKLSLGYLSDDINDNKSDYAEDEGIYSERY